MDYNFYDEFLLGNEPIVPDDQIFDKESFNAQLRRIQMQEADAFKLYNKIFDDEKAKISLELPKRFNDL